MTFRASAIRSQTPEFMLKARAAQVAVHQGGGTLGRTTSRPSLPPSSFREGSSSSRAPSRSGSRAGSYTPSLEYPVHEYFPGNPKDPLDVEVGNIVNSIAHGLLVERVDPPLKKIPKDGEEIKAQYSFSNALSTKIVTCRLTTMTRLGKGKTDITKKVMCRVGGGACFSRVVLCVSWLTIYISRMARPEFVHPEPPGRDVVCVGAHMDRQVICIC